MKQECPLTLVVAAMLCCHCGGGVPLSTAPWTVDRPFRVSLTIDAGNQSRLALPVIVELEGAAPLAESLQVVEVDSTGGELSSSARAQVDVLDENKAALTVLVPATTRPDGPRRFLVYFATEGSYPATGTEKGIRTHAAAGNTALRIETATCTWNYDLRGAGFASLVDPDGNDWLGYRPGGGPAGEYRGLPNLAHPEGYFHPGGTECETRVTANGPLRVRLESTCGGGAWAARWDVFDRFARMTVLRAGHPFWFLYEGTPGGKLDAQDFVGRSDGKRLSAAESWNDDLPDPEWVYFGDPDVPRVLWLAHLEGDAHPDAYYPMKGEMTVFGFGRRRLERFLTDTPATFAVGFVESTDHETIAAHVASSTAPFTLPASPVVPRPSRP